MYKFFRMDKDAQHNDVLTEVQLCAIQGDRIPEMPDKYSYVLFYLGINPDDTIFVRKEYLEDVPQYIIDMAEAYINNTEDKRSLPTYFYTHIILNGERVPHLHLVYIAESEDKVWEYVEE